MDLTYYLMFPNYNVYVLLNLLENSCVNLLISGNNVLLLPLLRLFFKNYLLF